MRILGVVSSSSREVPNAPTIGAATDVGTARAFNNGAATVAFTAPTFDGGLPITGYTVTSSPGSLTATGSSSPLTVAGLTSSTAYTFTARATNAVGQSSASAASNSITATTVPQAPTIGAATDGGTGSTVSVAFTAGSTGGKAVSTYTATSSPGGLTGTSASSPITVSGLTAGTAYTFTVTATNANGTSTASSASNSVTPTVPSSFDSIASATGDGSSDTITFSSIPSTYKSLQVRVFTLETNPAVSLDNGWVRLNGATSGYSTHSIQGNGTSTYANAQANADRIHLYNLTPAANNTNMGGAAVIDIIDYASTTKNKTVRAIFGCDVNGNGRMGLGIGAYLSTTAVSSVTIATSTKWATGTVIALYGIKG